MPLVYLNGGPDKMIENIPTWAPVVTAIAAVTAATIAYRAFKIARDNLATVVKNQKETTAKSTFREFLKLCVEKPSLAYGRPAAGEEEKYEWFVAQFLWAAEEILEYAPDDWDRNLKLHISYHRDFLQNNRDFRNDDLPTYSTKLRTFLDATLRALPPPDPTPAPAPTTPAPTTPPTPARTD
ncbi:hypothetical protein [Bradyrhizobium sp. Ghvi]|uniref:hypothetical protein n=1 Tax=Bradyrhizobium sp. Ghvi TaxID=1855319 RepID=UPI0011774E53|nr:hypothetical protein [Bradyrhizobium sp. Ghvi]